MTGSPHYKELLQALNDFQVEYLIVGGYALMKYTEPRYVHALANFGAPLQNDGITPETFSQNGVVYQIGVVPVRIDILTQIAGVEFAGAWRGRIASTIFGVPVNFISLEDLIANKQAAGRAADLGDLKRIQRQAKHDAN